MHNFESSLWYYVFVYLYTVEVGLLIRSIFGPLPQFVCWWIIYLRNAVPNAMQLSLDFNMVFRVSIMYISHFAVHGLSGCAVVFLSLKICFDNVFGVFLALWV